MTLINDTDENIVKAIALGDSNALAVLYDRYSKKLFGTALAIVKNRTDAEDLLHDVFEEVSRKAANYNSSKAKVSTWLTVMLKSRALDRIRSINRYIGLVDRYRVERSGDAYEEVSIDDAWTTLSSEAGVLGAINSLSLDHREVIELSYLREMSQAEVAGRLQIPIGTVKSRIHFALKMIRSRMN